MNLSALIALNDQIRALVRAGVPLDAGLTAMASDVPGELGDRFAELGRRLADGEDLVHVLAEPRWGVPPAYQAVVAAGTRAGRLEVALEGIATSARLQLDIRRQATTALVYPIVVLFLTYGVFVLLAVHVLPSLAAAHQELLQRPAPVFAWVSSLGDSAWWWAPWPPLALALLLCERWWRAGRLSEVTIAPPGIFVLSAHRPRQLGAYATMADVLALLLEHQVPAPEALELAAEASGGPALRAAAAETAQRMRAGDRSATLAASRLPVWLRWLLENPSPRLPAQLRLAARQYRDEAQRVAWLFTGFLPLAATLLVGGIAVLSYSLLFFVPFTELLSSLGAP